MYTPKQVADQLGLSGTTIRNYGRQWSDYLSPSANPEAGQARLYTEGDLAVLTTIAALRENQATTAQVRAALDAGERLEPVRPPEADRAGDTAGHADQDQQADQARAAVAAAEKALALYQDRVTAVEARADQLADRLIEAERRAAAAEKELDILRQLYEAATNPDRDPDRPLSFWEWVQSKRK